MLAKLALCQGRLVNAFDRFAALSELSLRRTNESWSAWGPVGQAEAGLYLGRLGELVRACEVLSELRQDAALKARAERLWGEMRAGAVALAGAVVADAAVPEA